MPYHVEFRPAARREINKFPQALRDRIHAAVSGLEREPRPSGVKKLAGYTHRWRIRVGDYRVIYEIHDDRLVVVIIRAAHRREAY